MAWALRHGWMSRCANAGRSMRRNCAGFRRIGRRPWRGWSRKSPGNAALLCRALLSEGASRLANAGEWQVDQVATGMSALLGGGLLALDWRGAVPPAEGACSRPNGKNACCLVQEGALSGTWTSPSRGRGIAQPLLPYPDWKRPAPATVPPADPLVRDLLRFLADPVAESHHIRRVQSDRSHVEAYVQRHELDLDLTTVRKGTPHTLV